MNEYHITLINGTIVHIVADYYRLDETCSIIGAGVPTEYVFMKKGPKWYSLYTEEFKVPFHSVLLIEKNYTCNGLRVINDQSF